MYGVAILRVPKCRRAAVGDDLIARLRSAHRHGRRGSPEGILLRTVLQHMRTRSTATAESAGIRHVGQAHSCS